MRFLLSRRWVLFALAVAVLAVLCVRLGEWQFDRLHQREQRNAWVRANVERDPVPVEDVLSVGGRVAPSREWTRVTARGVYDADHTVVVRYQSRDGKPGVDLVTPLVTASGTALLVDRGWVPADNTGSTPATLPDPPAGEVAVVGYLRADAQGDATAVEDGSTRAVSSRSIAALLDEPVYGGWVHAASEDPAPAADLARAELPELGEGPHLFYGIQWWFFGALALFGFGYLAWDERRQKSRAARTHATPASASEAVDPEPARPADQTVPRA